MKILILEDNDNRIIWFKENYPDATIVKTSIEAITHLNNNRYDLIFLDHDLGNQVYQHSGPGTGYEVAQKLATLDIENTVIIIHSWNHAGAANMLWELPKARYIPFGAFKKIDIDSFINKK